MLNKIIDKYLSENKLDVNELKEAKDEILANAEEYLKYVNTAIKGYKEAPLTPLYSLLLISADYKPFYNVLLKVYSMSDKKQEIHFGDFITEILPYGLILLNDGNLKSMERILLSDSKSASKSAVFDMYARVCNDTNNQEAFYQFIMKNAEKELYDGLYDDIVDAFVDYKYDRLLSIVKYLYSRNMVSDLNDPYLDIIDLYLVNPIKSFKADDIYFSLSNFVEVSGLGEYELDDKYFIAQDELLDRVKEYYLNNKYENNLDEYLPGFIENMNAKSIYPEKEIKAKFVNSKVFDLDYQVYELFLAERALLELENVEVEPFLTAYYEVVVDIFEKFLSDNRISYEKFDLEYAIHFISSDMYEA